MELRRKENRLINGGGSKAQKFELQNRRYIGNKSKLADWIMQIILKETQTGNTFIDIFSGTGIVAQTAMKHYKKVILNDFLYANNIIYQAFFNPQKWSVEKILEFVHKYNTLKPNELKEDYFSKNFGGKFYEKEVARIIDWIRKDIEARKEELNAKEYAILLASLIYSMDKLANTVGHFDAYIKKNITQKPFQFKLIQTADFEGVEIHQEDANLLAKKVIGDVAYIDPPYNSRQYSRFYHVYENLVKWEKPQLYGVALKPQPENMSQYCTVKAKEAFRDLVESLEVEYLAVSYNNTYKSKSKSSENKIKLEEIQGILENLGKTKMFQQSHPYFNTGKTNFENHKEFLFITKKYG